MTLTIQGKFLFGEFSVDAAHRVFQREGETVALNPRTFDLLVYMVSNAQRVVTKEELMRALWPDARVEESNLTQHIFLLRKVLTASQPGEKLIVTVPGRGYQFTHKVTEISPNAVDGSPRLILHAAETVAQIRLEEEEETSPAPVTAPVRASAPTQPQTPSPAPERAATPSPTPVRSVTPSVVPAAVPSAVSEPVPTRPPVASPALGTKVALAPAPAPIEVEEESEAEPEPKKKQASRSGSRSRGGGMTVAQVAVAAVAVLAVGVGGWFGWRKYQEPHREAVGLVLAEFENSTGEAQLDQALGTALAIDLGQSPYLSITSREKVSDTLAEMKRPVDSRLTPELAREVCQRTNDQALLESGVSRFASQYFLTLQAFDCATGVSLGQSKGLSDTVEGILPLLDRVAADLRRQLGESGRSVDHFSKPLFSARTGSLAALRAYSEASRLGLSGKGGESIPLFQRAIELDPQFAIAYADLAATYSNLGEVSLAQDNLKKAYELRDTVGEQDRFYIVGNYNSKVTGDITASIANNRAWSAMYPRNPVPLCNLADLETQVGKPELAVDPARQALALNPNNAAAYTILARALMHAGRPEDAAATVRLAVAKQMDEAAIHMIAFQLAYLRHDQDGMDAELAWAKDKPAEPSMELQRALMYFAEGKAKAGEAAFHSIAEGYRAQGLGEAASRMLGALPRIEAELGLTESAYALLQKLPDIDGSTDIPVAWADVGEISKAESLLKRELDANTTSTMWQQVRSPEISAAIALNQQQPEAAIEALKDAVPYDLRNYDLPSLRGRAYLGSKQPMLAEYEFLHILDHPGVEPLSHNYALAQLGLARALAREGKTGKARLAYQNLFHLWQNADSDLPKLKDAKQEYGNLPKG